MPRDFRPKGKGSAARAPKRDQPAPSKPAHEHRERTSDDHESDSVLRREVLAMGGTDEDIALLQGKSAAPTSVVSVR